MSVPLEETIRAALLADDGVSALLGANLYIVQLPPATPFPCATFQRVSTNPIYTIDQPTNWGTFGWARFTFSIWCQGPSSAAQSDQIAQAIQSAMLGFNASVEATSPPVVIQAPNFLIGRRMLVEPQTSPPLFKAILDYRIAYYDSN